MTEAVAAPVANAVKKDSTARQFERTPGETGMRPQANNRPLLAQFNANGGPVPLLVSASDLVHLV